MDKIKLFLGASLLMLVSVQVNAIVIGNVEYDGTTITDENGRQYLGLDILADYTYSQTVTATGTGGDFEGWMIADAMISDQFINSILGGASVCDGAGTAFLQLCGVLTSWSDGGLGANAGSSSDGWFYLNSEGGATVGADSISHNGEVHQKTSWDEISTSDVFSSSDLSSHTITWLVYQDATVPEPSILALMISGILGLGFASRRKSSNQYSCLVLA